MPFIDDFILIGGIGQGSWHHFAGINPQAHRAALVNDIGLLWHQVDDRVGCQRGKFTAVGIGDLADVAGIFDHSALHAEAQTEERHLVFPGILNCLDFSFDSAVAKPARHQNPVDITEIFGQVAVALLDMLGIDPFDLHRGALGNPGVAQRFGNAHVRVRQCNIFTNQRNRDRTGRMQDPVYHRPPFGHIFRASLDIQFFNDDPV